MLCISTCSDEVDADLEPPFLTVRILYISYDGLLEPLGESQVVSYLERLASSHRITLLSFEKGEDLSVCARVSAMERRLAACGISWIRLRYHKHPPVLSTVLDAIVGIVRVRAICRTGAVAIVHARGYVPSLIALGSRGASGARFLFDMRGLWVDEKVEAGHWKPGGVLYRVGKWWERRFFEEADAIVSLTEQGVRAFPQLGYDVPPAIVEVIPTCVDLQRFTPGSKDPELLASLGLTDALVVGCIGTMSNWYMRHEMLRYLAYLTESFARVRVLIVTREDPAMLRQDAERAGIPRERLALTRSEFADMPRFVRLFDAGLFFIKPTLSKRGSAATKLAEFLACGIPVIINDDVGDSGAIVKRGQVGVVLSSVDAESVEGSLPGVRMILEDRAIGARCRKLAVELFDIERGVEKYRLLYRRLSTTGRRRAGVV